jgi:hypothetical protein
MSRMSVVASWPMLEGATSKPPPLVSDMARRSVTPSSSIRLSVSSLIRAMAGAAGAVGAVAVVDVGATY